MLAILELLAKAVLLAAVVLWLGDWLQLRLRAAHGSGFDTVQVEEYLSTPLKGNKTEYDYVGKQDVSCARALFPHRGLQPCWWLRRHTTQWE